LLGCKWHACEHCYGDQAEAQHPIRPDKTWREIRQEDAKRLAKIRSFGFRIELTTSCKVKAERKKNPEMDAFFTDIERKHTKRVPIFSPREGTIHSLSNHYHHY